MVKPLSILVNQLSITGYFLINNLKVNVLLNMVN